jgi:uncharacterized RDD family membrane protein YckC
MSSSATVNREGVEGVPSMVVRAMGREWYKDYLADIDPLHGTRPEGASVHYVLNTAEASEADGDPILELASNGRRVAARLVDTLIASFFALCGFMAVAASTDDVALIVLVPVGLAAGGVIYFIPLVHWWGTTVGKRIFGLKIVRLWSDGTLPPSWKDAFLREFDMAAFLVIPVANILAAAILLARMAKDRGSYHQHKYDRAARTVVVRRTTTAVQLPS